MNFPGRALVDEACQLAEKRDRVDLIVATQELDERFVANILREAIDKAFLRIEDRRNFVDLQVSEDVLLCAGDEAKGDSGELHAELLKEGADRRAIRLVERASVEEPFILFDQVQDIFTNCEDFVLGLFLHRQRNKQY